MTLEAIYRPACMMLLSRKENGDIVFIHVYFK